ncbi:MAG: CHASE domain-containing protein [Cephaloticoccus sp.]|nr:CHASE domain-containing protein [Cephaloticoccus sp.]
MSPTPRPFFLRRRNIVLGIATFGSLLSLYGYHWMVTTENARIEAEFDRRAALSRNVTQQVIDEFGARVFGLRHLFIASDQVTRAEFAIAAQDILDHHPGFAALEWVPVVPEAERTRFEAQVSRELGQPFAIVTKDSDGRMIAAPAASEHLPILYVEPLAGNEPALGYDLAFGPTIDALGRARATGKMASSRRIRLVQETNADRQGVIFIWPVFSKNNAGQARLLGYVQGVVRISEIFGEIYRMRNFKSLDALYLDPEEQDPANRVVHYLSGEGQANVDPSSNEAAFRAGTFRENSLKIGNHYWKVLYRPSPGWLDTQYRQYPIFRLLGGLVMTALLCGLIHALGRRTESIEQEVEERTSELTESRRQLEGLMQNLPGMAIRTPHSPPGAASFISEGAHALTGYTARELMASQPNFRDVIHPEDLPMVRTQSREALTEKRSFEFEYRIRTRSGGQKWVLSRGHGVYAEDGSLQFTEGLIIDITAQKRAEAEKISIERRMQEHQKLESLAVLAGGVAHDFNNLLTTILGNAGIIRMKLPAETPVAGYLANIETASRHAAALCRQMLIYAGKGELTQEPVDLGELVSSVHSLLQTSVAAGIKLQIEGEDNLPKTLGDPTQLRQILLNLVINASEAMGGKSGEITITTSHRSVDQSKLEKCVTGRELPAGRYVTLTVQDQGSGMPAEMIERIFDPFYSTKFVGRGLGLAAVLGIVRSHHGALHVSSQSGHGTCFELILQPVTATAPLEIPGPTAAATKPGALVVDDDEPVLAVTAELMRSLGYEVSTATNGKAAIDLFVRSPARYQVVLLDCVMPGLNGTETMKRLCAIKPDLLVLMMSGQTITAPALGERQGFLAKPFNRTELNQALQLLQQS